MPLTLAVKRNDSMPLGSVDDVVADLAERLDGFTAFRGSTLDEKLAAMPEELRELYAKTVGHIAPATMGDYTTGNLSVEFGFGSNDTPTEFSIELRGNGDAMRTLRDIVGDNAWDVIAPDGTIVDLGDDTLDCWTEFIAYRDANRTANGG